MISYFDNPIMTIIGSIRKLSLLSIFFALSMVVMSQGVVSLDSGINQANVRDVFFVRIRIDSVFMGKKFIYDMGGGTSSYHLCKIKITEVYHIADSFSLAKPELLNAGFMLIITNEQLVPHSSPAVSLFASDNKNVLFFNRLLSDAETKTQDSEYHPVISQVFINDRKLERLIRRINSSLKK